MASPREGPNPLRPYYIPPSVGSVPDQPTANSTSAFPKPPAPKGSFGSSARDILSDLDYADYLSDSSPSVSDLIKSLIDNGLWKYTSVLLAQPFDVAKTILQCHLATAPDGALTAAGSQDLHRRSSQYKNEMYSDLLSDESDPDEPSYFTANTPRPRGRSPPHRLSSGNRQRPSSRQEAAPHKLELRKPDSLLEVIGQLWHKEGAFGVWKGSNATFLYSVILKAVEAWTRSLLAAIVNVPDPGFVSSTGIGGVDVVDSPFPLTSLGVAVAAAGIASILLSPLDIARTRLILTPSSHHPQGLIPILRSLRSLACPAELFPVTFLHGTVPALINTGTPLFLRFRMGIDPILTPTTYSVATFLSSATELFLRLPLETVLRRGQANTKLLQPPETQSHDGHLPLPDSLVDIGPYKGVFGTMWSVVFEEGTSGQQIVAGSSALATRRAQKGRRKGQGIEGLFRGWRVGMWGLVGVWGAAAIGTGSSGKVGEF